MSTGNLLLFYSLKLKRLCISGICLVFFRLAVASPAGTGGDFVFSPELVKAYSDIQKLRLEKARNILIEERGKKGENGFIPYLESYSDFFYFLVTDNQKDYAAFGKRQEARLEQLAKLSGASPYQRMMMAEIRLHSAFVKLKFGNRTSGSWDIIKANRLLGENLKLFPEFVPHLKALGLLHVMIGSVPEDYQWVARMMGLRGTVRQGLAELATVEKESGLFGKEARVTALLLHAYVLQPDERLIAKLKEMPYDEPDNLLFHFLSASILMKRSQGEAALAILDRAPRSGEYVAFPFLHYMKAEVSLQKRLYSKAATEYDHFLNQTRGINYLKDSYFKKFLCTWLDNGMKPQAGLLSKVMSSGAMNVEADKHAQSNAERFLANKIDDGQKVLFEARYAFDGGFLTSALSVLEGVNEASFSHIQSKIEYNYRLGRILQQQGKTGEAIPFLKRALQMNQGYEYYFGASAALQLGYIYRKAGQPDTAAGFFKKAMSFKKHEYKNSIDNKARAALTELGVK